MRFENGQYVSTKSRNSYGFINLKGFVNPRGNREKIKRQGINYLSVDFFKSLFSNKYMYIAENDRNNGAIFPSRIMTDTKASDLYLKLKPFLRVVEGGSNGNYPKYHLWGESTDRTPFIRLGYSLFVIWDCSKESRSYDVQKTRELTFKEFISHYNIKVQQGE